MNDIKRFAEIIKLAEDGYSDGTEMSKRPKKGDPKQDPKQENSNKGSAEGLTTPGGDEASGGNLTGRPKNQARPSAGSQLKSTKPNKPTQSKNSIAEMQKAMLAFRTEFASMAIGSNQIGRKETNEYMDSNGAEAKQVEDLKKKIVDARAEVYRLSEANESDLHSKPGQKEPVVTNATKAYDKAAQNLQNLQNQLNLAMGNSTQKRDIQGLRPLGQILLNDYIGKNALQGVTFSDVDMKQPGRMTEDTGQVDNQEFAGVINTIGRVGTPSNVPNRAQSPQEKALEKQIDTLESSRYEAKRKYFEKNPPQKSKEDPYGEESMRQMESKLPDPYSPRIKKLNEQLMTMKGNLDKKHEEDYLKKNPAKGEDTEDGIWDVRTNNSLKNIAAIMKGVMAFANDMQIKVEGYDQSLLEKFNKGIPDDPKLLSKRIAQKYPDRQSEEIKKYCEIVQLNIEAQTRYLHQFKRVVFNNEKYNQFLTQSEALYDFDKTTVPNQQEHDEKRKLVDSRSFIQSTPSIARYIKHHFGEFDNKTYGAGLLANIDGKQVQVTYQSISTFPGLEKLFNTVYGRSPESNKEMVDFVSKIRTSVEAFKEQSQYVAPNQDFITQYKTVKEETPNTVSRFLPKRTEYTSQPYQAPYRNKQ